MGKMSCSTERGSIVAVDDDIIKALSNTKMFHEISYHTQSYIEAIPHRDGKR